LRGTISASINLAVVYAMNKTGTGGVLTDKQSAAFLATVAGSPLVEKLVDRLLPAANSHPPELDREAKLRVYAAQNWPNALPTLAKPNPFDTGSLGQQTTLVADAVQGFGTANGDIANRQFGQASPLIYSYSMSQYLPMSQELLRAKLDLAEGDTRQAAEILDGMVQDPNAPAVTYTLLAGTQAQTGDTGQALQTLDDGKTRFGSDEAFVVYRISLLQHEGRTNDVNEAVQECNTFGDDTLMSECQKAATPPLQLAGTP